MVTTPCMQMSESRLMFKPNFKLNRFEEKKTKQKHAENSQEEMEKEKNLVPVQKL